MDGFNVLVKWLANAVQIIPVQRANKTVIVHVEFLHDSVVPQLRKCVDNRAEDHVQQQNRNKEVLHHHESKSFEVHWR